MNPVRVIYHHEPDGWWAESPDVDTVTRVGHLADDDEPERFRRHRLISSVPAN